MDAIKIQANHRLSTETKTIICRQLILSGHVQGVGFRPFVYRLGKTHQLTGWVQNQLGQVSIMAQGQPANIQRFVDDLIAAAPPLAKPVIDTEKKVACQGFHDFSILESQTTATANIFVPPDYFTCDDCQREINDPKNRRYRYPFTNCTQCGPRYTLINAMPYDRPNTTMADFPLCDACAKEYQNPLDRRFHAEPIACPVCGPQLMFQKSGEHIKTSSVEQTQVALAATVMALKSGEIIAVKGIGGYHLMCDAQNNQTVLMLRKRKQRPHKPLAVMFPTSEHKPEERLQNYIELNRAQQKLLTSPMRPIVLAKKKSSSLLANAIAPGLDEIGVFLPYSPLHYLLLKDFDGPLVATSGNLSGEPVITDSAEASARLQPLANGFIHHNRPIARPAEDPVFRYIAGRPRPIRLGRGCSPLELNLPWIIEHPTLAVGAHLKNTIALAWNDRVVVSPHIGEMSSPRSLKVFEQTIDNLQKLYGQTVDSLVSDTHPTYTTRRWANSQALPVTGIQHHIAHASALIGDFLCRRQAPAENIPETLVFVWDGVGFGNDGTLWGGETFLGRPANWRRVASIRPFDLSGGELASRQPWRCAASLCWQADFPFKLSPPDISKQDLALVFRAWQNKMNCPRTSSVGRLFDGASSLILNCKNSSFEGQAPMHLEAIAKGLGKAIDLPLVEDNKASGLLRADWEQLLPRLTNEAISPAQRAADFHQSLAHLIVKQAVHFRDRVNVDRVGLCGGVFQNKRLTETASNLLKQQGFKVILSERLPVNDAAISFGQIIEQSARLNQSRTSKTSLSEEGQTNGR